MQIKLKYLVLFSKCFSIISNHNDDAKFEYDNNNCKQFCKFFKICKLS